MQIAYSQSPTGKSFLSLLYNYLYNAGFPKKFGDGVLLESKILDGTIK